MLAKHERLTRADFGRFFKKGRRSSGRYVQLIYTPHPTLHGSVVVSKKIAKRAVDRNRIRRRVYAMLQGVLRAQQRTGVFIFIVLTDLRDVTPVDLRSDIEALVARALH